MMIIWLISLILLVVLILLITERLPIDLTALGIMVVLVMAGILTPVEAVQGFANPAVITVAAMFMISRGMLRTGAVGFLAQTVIDSSRGNRRVAILAVLLLVAVASAFINNTPVVVLFIPIVLSLGCEYGLSPSKLLIPVSYASILAGTCTLIGTSTNIIVSDLSMLSGYGELKMFELAKLGLPIAVLGLALILLLSPHVMPSHALPTCELEDREDKRYLAELRIPPDSPLIGLLPDALLTDKYPTLELFEVIREPFIYYPHRNRVVFAPEDLLLVKGSANDLVALLSEQSVILPHQEEGLNFGRGMEDELIVELIVPPQSSLIRERLMNTSLRGDPDVQIIAIKSRGQHYSEQKIRYVRLGIGDIILVRIPSNKLAEIRRGSDFIIVEDVHYDIVHKNKARWSLSIFLGVVAAATTGLADIMVCALTGVFLMVLSGCMRLREAYRALQADVLILIAGTIALGHAMEKTGASQLYAHYFLELFHGSSPVWVLGGVIILTSISTQLLSNNATAVLLLPIAISTALALEVNPRPFIIGVCIGASACFASPIGYQTNLLVYGPGSYRFIDYLKLGLPLNFLVVVMGTLMIPRIWPF